MDPAQKNVSYGVAWLGRRGHSFQPFKTINAARNFIAANKKNHPDAFLAFREGGKSPTRLKSFDDLPEDWQEQAES